MKPIIGFGPYLSVAHPDRGGSFRLPDSVYNRIYEEPGIDPDAIIRANVTFRVGELVDQLKTIKGAILPCTPDLT